MKIDTHIKLLKLILGLRKENIKVQFDHNPNVVGGGYYDSEEKVIHINQPFYIHTLAHEFLHAKQFKKIYKKKYYKGFANYKEAPRKEDGETFDFENTWKMRRYRYQRVEKEAYRFARRYCFFTGEFAEWIKLVKIAIYDFFHYYLFFQSIINMKNRIKRLFKRKKHKKPHLKVVK